ncbi:BLUF domain-containing protein [Arthrobacter sp. TmT3-37]
MGDWCDDSDQGPDYEAGGVSEDSDEDLAYRGQADQDQHALTLKVMRRFGIPVSDLWTYYLGVGGDVDEFEVDAYLHGLIRLPALDRDLIAHSVNEMIDDMCREARAPYSSSRNETTPTSHHTNRGTAPEANPEANPGADPGVDLGVDFDEQVRAALRPGGDRSNNQDSQDNRDSQDGCDSPEGDGILAGVQGTDGAARKEQVLSIVYSSTATRPFSDADLAELLAACRRTNNSSHLTGMLLYRQGRFLQVLEGPEATVRDRMDIIRADPRHTRIRVLIDDTINERQFPDWTMGYEPLSATMSDEVPGYERTFTDADNDPDPTTTIQVLLKLIRWFQDRAIPLR